MELSEIKPDNFDSLEDYIHNLHHVSIEILDERQLKDLAHYYIETGDKEKIKEVVSMMYEADPNERV